MVKGIINSIGGAIEKIGDAADKNITTKEELLEKTNEIRKVLIEAQAQVRLAEAQGSWLQRSWRPISAMSLLVVVIYTTLIAPIFSLPTAELTQDFWDLLQLVMGGYVVGRSIEKTAKTVNFFTRKRKTKDDGE